ncbi:hypothetical protein AB0D14_09595 [Streptomyces sp. NPDC048484]|uniref:hypothetical protein n=1 Tax=Streptomyces sp. NPDC048484 TaxID=3155146 RepID=UPI00342799C5
MFSRKKIAAVSGILGGLVVTCTGGAQAYAADPPASCGLDKQGTITCVQRVVGKTPEGEGFIVRQSQSCVPTQPLQLPVIPLLNSGRTRIGPEVTCAPNSAPEPDTSDDTDNRLELPGLLG